MGEQLGSAAENDQSELGSSSHGHLWLRILVLALLLQRRLCIVSIQLQDQRSVSEGGRVISAIITVMSSATYALQLAATEDARQQQHPERDGQQQHEGKGQCHSCRHDNPQQRQTCQLDQREQMHP